MTASTPGFDKRRDVSHAGGVLKVFPRDTTTSSGIDLIERHRADLGGDAVSQPVNVTACGGIDAIAGLFGGAPGALSIRRDQRTVLLDDPAMVPKIVRSRPLSASG